MGVPRTAIRFALTGFGQLARHVHVPVLNRLPGVELAAIAEVDAGRRNEARRRAPQARLYESQEEMLARADFQALVISTPPVFHADLAIAAIERGRHVYLEKPAAACLDDARRILEVWRAAGVVGMMGFNYRFRRAAQSARRQIRAGRIGELRAVRSVFSIASPEIAEWKASRRSGGGALLDLMSHHIDVVRFLCGAEIREVSARIWSQRTEHDCVALDLKLQSGVSVQSFSSFCATEEDVVEIYGDRAKLTVDRYRREDAQITAATHRQAHFEQLVSELRNLVPGAGFWTKLRAPLHEPSYQAAMQRFVDSIRGQPATDAADLLDGYRCQEVMAAAEESARTGQVVLCGGVVPA